MNYCIWKHFMSGAWCNSHCFLIQRGTSLWAWLLDVIHTNNYHHININNIFFLITTLITMIACLFSCAICSYLSTFKPWLSVWNIGKHCHLNWKIPCKVDHVLVVIHPYFRYSQGIAFHCNTQVLQVRLVGSFQMSNSRTGQYFYFTSTLPGLDQEERMSGEVAYFFKLYAFLLKRSHFWSP